MKQENQPGREPTAGDCMRELAELLQQAHLQVEVGYHFAGNSMGQFHWMIRLFAESFPEKYRKLLTDYTERQEDLYRIEAHTLKSNAKGIGAERLSRLAREHEQQAEAGDWAYVQAHWDELVQEWSCVVNGIWAYLGEDPVLPEAAAAGEDGIDNPIRNG